MSSKSKKKSNSRHREKSEMGTMRQMNNMMNNHLSMMNSLLSGSPFGMLEAPGPGLGRSDLVPYGGAHPRRMRDDFGMALMPPTMGLPGMRSVFQDMANSGNSHSFSQSTVMTMSSGPDGRPQIYQASSSMRQGPGGVKETRKSVADSRTGVKKMQIGHHIGERAHLVEREKNFHSGEAEQREEFINLEEDEADDFNREWQNKAGGGRNPNAIGYTERRRQHHHAPQHQHALPSSSTSSTSKRKKSHKVMSED